MSQQNATDPMYVLVETMVRAIVDHEDQVKINVVRGRHNVVYEVELHPEDIALSIGKEGQNAKAMRTILNAAARKLGVKYNLDIITDRNTPPPTTVPTGEAA